jgi:Holliday junction resolvasome RuvABC DNA-binding subunit
LIFINNQSIAYAAIAMEQLGYTREQIEKVQASMLSEIDWTDEKTAEKKSYSSK